MDIDAFLSSQLKPRKKTIKAPELFQWFPNDPECQIEISGLTGEEMAQCNEDVKLNLQIPKIMSSLGDAGENALAVVDTVLKALGAQKNQLPNDFVLKLGMVRFGTGWKREVVNKFAMAFPARFQIIANEIAGLTGEGHVTEEK